LNVDDAKYKDEFVEDEIPKLIFHVLWSEEEAKKFFYQIF
jgi:hypothetical protein